MRRWRQPRAEVGGEDISRKFFVVSAYLSTATVLYKRDGSTTRKIEILRKHTSAMSFDEIYSPGFQPDVSQQAKLSRIIATRSLGADFRSRPGDAPPADSRTIRLHPT